MLCRTCFRADHCRDVGVRLLCYLLDRGWPASARMVLTTLLDCAAPVASFQAIASAVAACNGERLGLLHRAVRSGQVATVVEVLGWAVQQQVCLSWAAKGPGSLTPLHLLALGKDQGSARASVDGPGLQQSLAGVILQQLPGALTQGLHGNLAYGSLDVFERVCSVGTLLLYAPTCLVGPL
jgi:hypothetical protein